MGCFTVDWLLHFLLWLVVVGVLVAIFRILLPVILGLFGVAGGVVMQVINILILGIVLIALIYFLIDLAHCARFALRFFSFRNFA